MKCLLLLPRMKTFSWLSLRAGCHFFLNRNDIPGIVGLGSSAVEHPRRREDLASGYRWDWIRPCLALSHLAYLSLRTRSEIAARGEGGNDDVYDGIHTMDPKSKIASGLQLKPHPCLDSNDNRAL